MFYADDFMTFALCSTVELSYTFRNRTGAANGFRNGANCAIAGSRMTFGCIATGQRALLETSGNALAFDPDLADHGHGFWQGDTDHICTKANSYRAPVR